MQHEYDESDAVKVHLIDGERVLGEGRFYAVCSGLEYDPGRRADDPGPRVTCPACEVAANRLAQRRMMRLIASNN